MTRGIRPVRLPRVSALVAVARVVAAAVLLVLSAALPATALPPRPTGFAVSNGNGQVTLTWDAPAEDADIWHHEYRFKTTGDYNDWKKIDDSEVGKSHEDWVVVTGLTNDVAYTFQLRIVNRDGNGNEVTASQATPTDGFCGRTEQVRLEIMRQISGVSDCAVVTSAQLAGVMSLDFASVVIKSLQPGDFSGLTALTDLTLSGNELSLLPAGAFSGLTALTDLTLSDNELSSLPAGAFSGLTALTDLTLSDNELSSLPVGAFSGLTALKTLNLDRNELRSLPAGVFSGLTALTNLALVSNELRSLPAGVFSDLTALTDLSLFRNELTSLPAGVFSDLTALTTLRLESNELSSLPAGVFSDLTALTSLRLRYNKLSSLPAGVFSRLTALTTLRLGYNEFTSLPAGVFSRLTALTNLSLFGNKLSSLPAGVFSDLTALTDLYLRENTVDPLPLTVTLERNPDAVEIRAVVLTAAPFAVPLVVSVANGSLAGGAATITVPTGARESAWVGVTRTDGTAGAVTADIDLTPQPILPDKHDGYEFVKSASDLPLTVLDVPGAPAAPSVSAASSSSLTVMWSAPDDGGSAITDYDVQYRAGTSGDWTDGNHAGTATTATLTGLSASTSYQVQVRATNADGAGSWSDSGSGRTEDANAAPTFSSPATFDAAENQTSAGEVVATDSDADDDITGYAITGGADQSFFSIGATSGDLTFDAAPNYEDAQDQGTNNTYVVEVQATSGAGEREKTATQTITVTVTDVNTEAPGKPGAPTVTTASVSRLRVNWSAPANAGPAITDYDYRYRAGNSGGWTDGGHAGTAVTATLTGLSEDTSYQVQVRATNAEGTGAWSASGSGRTDANAAPAFTSDAEFDAAENQTTAGTMRATDSDADDDVTGYAITGGADQGFFSIGATSGALTFNDAPNFEDAQDQGSNNTYVVEVTATSGEGEREKTATQTITVTVTDVSGEAPGKPGAPMVAPASVSSLSVNWSAPSNAGPAITDYDVQYRAGTSGGWSDGTHSGTAVTTTLTGLSENTSYQVQVRATNAEGTGDWSESGSGVTDANAAPSFSSPATFDAAENQTAAGTVEATDSDAGDDVTGYAITGGADQAFFSIGTMTDGALTFNDAPNFEDAQDQGSNNTYVVEVTATSGMGEREKTATQTITVTVTDVNTEAPGKPNAPTVSPASVSSLSVNWSAPSNAGPAITDYDVQYRAGTSGAWSDGTHNGTAITATLTGLSENTSYQVQVRATNDEGTGSWSESGSGRTDANAAPSFSSAATFSAAENQTAAGTVLATDSDGDDDVTGYAITGGADQAFFSIVPASGALTFKTAPNFEDAKDQGTNNTYVVTVQATSGMGERVKTATQTITVTVTDVNTEAPGKPGAPMVAPASVSRLTVNWSVPANAGPAITDYDVQYREGTGGSWTDGNHTGAATTATIGSLSENTSYDVQVRATNAEGTGAWSDAGTGATDANAAPSFSSAATFSAAENQTTVGTVVAADSDADDSITGYALSGGADRDFFSIVAASGALTFQSAPNFEDAKDLVSVDPANAAGNNQYVVEVTATSGMGEREKTATQTIMVRVTDLDTEAPGKPGAPTVSAASVSSLTVTWTAPSNAGPAITDYDYRHRTTSPEGTWTEVTGTTITGLSATIGSLEENTSYDVQVRAKNDEGAGDWSDAGTGATDANAAPMFSSDATFIAAENQTTAGTVLATDSDADDDVTGYAITGGADQGFFSIGATSGALTFNDAPNFEDAKDQGTNNTYVVEVTATSGMGEREKTATQTITVTVTDVSGEAPGKPGAPMVAPASVSRLTVNWSVPANAGPAITDYDVQYRAGTSGAWSDGTHNGTAVTTTLTGLSENTSYQVQVRATNAEGTGDWSESGSGVTDANAAPSFSSPATFDAAENQTAAGTVLATDSDGDDDVTGYAITGGADQAFFSIVPASGALTFKTAPNFEDAKDQGTNNTYVVTVQATSGMGERVKTATQTITVTVTDVNTEAPGKPAAPTVSPASVTSLTVTWTAPSNAGPAITDYDVQYRAGTSGAWSDGTHNGTAITATLTGLSENTSYQVQVRATNDEGTGSWSESGSGRTDANAAPSFSSAATFSL